MKTRGMEAGVEMLHYGDISVREAEEYALSGRCVACSGDGRTAMVQKDGETRNEKV